MNARWTRAEVDEAVARWNRDLGLATQNILELMDDPYYKWLAGSKLEGRTEREARPLLQALDAWWNTLPKLNEIMDSVNVLASKLSRWSGTEDLLEIQEKLEGKSVELTHKTAYTQRGLLTPDELTERVSPGSVLSAMIDVYARAKALVLRIGEITTQLNGQLSKLTEELAALRAEADSLGEPCAELEPLEARAAEAQKQIARDPLSAHESFDASIRPAISSLRARLAGAAAERADFEASMASAPALLAALEKAYEASGRAYRERAEKVAVDGREPLPVEVIDELRAWLGRLEKTQRAGAWRAARIGLANWRAQRDARAAQCEQVAREAEHALARRRELRGLLEGLRAKAIDTRRAEDEELGALYRRAYELLHTRPTPLDAAEKLVLHYLNEVRGSSVESHG